MLLTHSFLLGLVLVVLPLCPQAHSSVVQVPEVLTDGTGLLYAHRVEGGPLWDPRAVWGPVRVRFNCTSAAYNVLVASTLSELKSPAATKVLWCGWRNILHEPNVCDLQFSMFQTTHFAVKPTTNGLLSIGQSPVKCEMSVDDTLRADIIRGVVTTVAALLLFSNAGRLSRSQWFRLTGGGLMGVTGFAVILLLIVMRNAPAKRAIGAGFALSTTGMLGIMRWAYGTWMPGIQQILLSRVGVWYIIITGTAGVAITYWMDNPDNQKINTSVRVALQLLALGVVYFSIVDDKVAIAVIIIAMTLRYTMAIIKSLWAAIRYLNGWCVRHGLFLGKRRVIQVDESDQELNFPLLYDEASYHSSQDEDYEPDSDEEVDNAKGGIATEPEEDSEGDSEEEQDEPAPAPVPARARMGPPANVPGGAGAAARGSDAGGRLGWLWGRAAAGAAAGGVSAAAGDADKDLDHAPSFDQWAQPVQQQQGRQQGAGVSARAAAQASLAGAGAAGDAGAGRAPGSASGRTGWGSTLVAVDRTQGTNNQQQQQQPEVQRPSSTSPWSERKVVDFSQPKPRSPPGMSPAGGGAAPGSSRPSAAAAAAAVGASTTPKGISAKIVNPETGREIAMHGATYDGLLARGYQYNPSTHSLELTDGQSPAPAVPMSRGAPTPSSNLRSRRPSRV